MEAIILVHGIKGAVLSLGAEIVWPPAIPEAIFGYERIDKLLDPACVPTAIIDSVGCFPVYQPLNDDLSTICNDIGAQKEVFVYDWRLDIYNKTADALARKIEQLAHSGATAITLVCHSMGGLVGRLLLESGTYSNKPWFSNIKRFVGVCCPNLGAPIALSQCLGLESSDGVSGSDLKRFAADPRYPAAVRVSGVRTASAGQRNEPARRPDAGPATDIGIPRAPERRARFPQSRTAHADIDRHVRRR